VHESKVHDGQVALHQQQEKKLPQVFCLRTFYNEGRNTMKFLRLLIAVVASLALIAPVAHAKSTTSGASKSRATSSSAKNAKSSGAAKSRATSSAAKSKKNSRRK
jgi:hypothetical protein